MHVDAYLSQDYICHSCSQASITSTFLCFRLQPPQILHIIFTVINNRKHGTLHLSLADTSGIFARSYVCQNYTSNRRLSSSGCDDRFRLADRPCSLGPVRQRRPPSIYHGIRLLPHYPMPSQKNRILHASRDRILHGHQVRRIRSSQWQLPITRP